MNLDLSSPKRLFLSLINPITFDEFCSKFWEEKPLVVSRGLGDIGSDGIFSLSHRTLRYAVKNNQLHHGRDLNIIKYSVSGKKEILTEKGILSLSTFDRLVIGGNTSAHFIELQRYQDDLWQAIELLESFFGTLVGSRVVVSPVGAQKLATALQFSNAETFILQTEGETCWRLYSPVSPLSRHFSEEVPPDALREPTHEVLLRAGDSLYFPRGTVYQNISINTNAHSTYVSFYTYQHVSWGDYLQSVFPSLIQDAMESDIDFRRGLPINFLKSTKLTKNSKFQSVLGILLHKLAKSRTEKFPVPKDLMETFMERRMPPYKTDCFLLRSTLPGGTPPDLSCKVRLKYPEHLSFMIADRIRVKEYWTSDLQFKHETLCPNDSASNQLHFLSQSLIASDDTQVVFVFSSLLNSRLNHLMPLAYNQTRENLALALILPLSFFRSLEVLKSSSEHFIPAVSLPLSNPSDQEELVRALWSRHLLECIPGFRSQPFKSTKLD